MARDRTRTSVTMDADVWRAGRSTAVAHGTTMWDLLERLVRLAHEDPAVLDAALALPPLDPDA
jgi:hypothetical protein